MQKAPVTFSFAGIILIRYKGVISAFTTGTPKVKTKLF